MIEDAPFRAFLDGKRERYTHFHGAPLGGLTFRMIEDEADVICWTEWGGWRWEARGTDRTQAFGHLVIRLALLDPMWDVQRAGPPGRLLGVLSGAFPVEVRERLMKEDVSG